MQNENKNKRLTMFLSSPSVFLAYISNLVLVSLTMSASLFRSSCAWCSILSTIKFPLWFNLNRISIFNCIGEINFFVYYFKIMMFSIFFFHFYDKKTKRLITHLKYNFIVLMTSIPKHLPPLPPDAIFFIIFIIRNQMTNN